MVTLTIMLCWTALYIKLMFEGLQVSLTVMLCWNVQTADYIKLMLEGLQVSLTVMLGWEEARAADYAEWVLSLIHI